MSLVNEYKHYLPKGPSDSQVVKEQASKKYSELMEHMRNGMDRLTYMDWSNRLTRELLGVSDAAACAEPSHREAITSMKKYVYSHSHEEGELSVPVITEDMKVPCIDSLEKLKKSRAQFNQLFKTTCAHVSRLESRDEFAVSNDYGDKGMVGADGVRVLPPPRPRSLTENHCCDGDLNPSMVPSSSASSAAADGNGEPGYYRESMDSLVMAPPTHSDEPMGQKERSNTVHVKGSDSVDIVGQHREMRLSPSSILPLPPPTQRESEASFLEVRESSSEVDSIRREREGERENEMRASSDGVDLSGDWKNTNFANAAHVKIDLSERWGDSVSMRAATVPVSAGGRGGRGQQRPGVGVGVGVGVHENRKGDADLSALTQEDVASLMEAKRRYR